ncbi:MAG: branched-chain alpha-keto acid dehydrogenase subunit E2 [Sphingomonadales bacterium 32-68-7]|nr:MAG: branched-chain alpha-keto acid dehydrogenase subunit E2 [Sphingomonadales bacterium 12-68-11]OYX09161.1 MAG: branched-chain alpha-keto acid dehydrogenase subunit E2 [Sphingomonadales bacterium 32-68-7]
MAKYTFRLPDIGEGIAEAEIVAWHVKIGDRVAEDGRLADLMTDKATVEMESPVSGTVLEVAGEVGDVIAIGSPLVVIETESEAAATADAFEVAVKPSPLQRRVLGEGDGTPILPESPRPPTPSPEGEGETVPHLAKALASPAVRQRARDLGIDLADVKPAADGRVRHADLDAFLSYGGAKGYAPAAPTRPDETIKVVGLRRRIAENMAAAKRHIPHFTYVEECDVTALEAMRAQLNEARGDRPKLTMLPLLIVAVCRALPKFPMLNARYDDEAGTVTRHGAVHMGMATMTQAGLMVPVIRGAQSRNLWQLAAEIARLSDAARNGTAKSEELSGSTFTLTSLGPLGGIASTPVINRPEVAIMAPNRIVERPAFVPDGMGGERIEKRKLMNLSLSCDHRVVDGYDAAAFVQEVKRLLEAPVLLLGD